MRLPNGGLHATLVIYDFKRNIIERFDPYGNTTLLDKDIDIVFQKELMYGKNIKYCDTSCYFPCINCAKILAASGIKEIVYLNDYKNDK